MRKNFEHDDGPDIRWTDAEIIAWVEKNGVLDAAKNIPSPAEEFGKSSGVSRRREQ